MRVKFKPEIMDAVQNDGTEECVTKLKEWIESDGGMIWISDYPQANAKVSQTPQLEKNLVIRRKDAFIYLVRATDWVVRAEEGQFFVMRDDDFKAVYKAANPVW